MLRTPTNDEYVPGDIVIKATEPCSYIMEAQGKHYSQTREHIRPIHLNIPVGTSLKQQPSKPKTNSPVPSDMSKPSPHLNSVYQPKMYLPQPFVHPPLHPQAHASAQALKALS